MSDADARTIESRVTAEWAVGMGLSFVLLGIGYALIGGVENAIAVWIGAMVTSVAATCILTLGVAAGVCRGKRMFAES